MKIEKNGKVVLVGLAVVACMFGLYKYTKAPKTVGLSTTIKQGDVAIPDSPEASLSGTAAVKMPFPSTKTGKGGLEIVWNEMAWQGGHMNVNFANGGARTTAGSLFEQAGLDITIVRQDNCTQSCTDMVKYIHDYAKGTTKKGFFITFMASGVPNMITGIAGACKDLGPDYAPVVFVASGKSYGEDQVIGSAEFKKNPQLLRGKVLRGVKLDGDIDVGIKFCGDNQVPVNPDATLYYRDALNLSYVGGDNGTYLTAVVDYNNTAYREKRKLVINGKTTGRDTLVGIDLVATWTPGDVNAHNGRGGATIISTKVYASIMPAMTITCKKFIKDNSTPMENLIIALSQAGDQIRSYQDAKKYAASLNAQIWNEQTPEYWAKYYDGVAVDNDTHLGGSMAFNLADMANIFGMNGSRDIYKDVYNTFGTLQSKMYPKDLASFIDYSVATDKEVINSVISNHPELLEGKALATNYTAPIDDSKAQVVGSKNVTIEFETGSAAIKPISIPVLTQLTQDISTSDGLRVEVIGHTDNTGNADANQTLSESRARSVVEYITSQRIKSERFTLVKGLGSAQPIANNNTVDGRQKNRRVQIKLVSN